MLSVALEQSDHRYDRAEGRPLRIGVSLEAEVLSNLPSGVVQRALDLPDVVSDDLFDHVLFDWNPSGHPPSGVYNVPHFDFHFVVVSQAKRSAVIPGTDQIPTDDQYLPSDYGPDANPLFAVARMGIHYVDLHSPEWNGASFTKTLIYGFYDGEFFFIEPMITRSFLLTQPDETIAIRQPDVFQKSGYYPTTYRINYDATEQVYHVVITDFVLRQANATSIDEGDSQLPVSFSLSQNFPNPFSSSTSISYDLPRRGFVSLRIYDMLGAEVASLVNTGMPAGSHRLDWNDGDLASGVYIYRLQAHDYVSSRILTLLK